MGDKNQNRMTLNWQASTPIPYANNVPLTGVSAGVMTGTNTIYSNIVDITIKDNDGLEFTWTGNPVGTVTILASNSGVNFYDMAPFEPPLGQPAGSAGGYLVNINQFPFKYLLVQYTNVSGSGTLKVVVQTKDIN